MSDRLSFGAAADLYDEMRPSYPPEAVRWALGMRPCRVVDLGAGTGILTRVLRDLGHEVVPVEPDPAMRDRLARATPGVVALDGSAERIPVPDGTVDAVVAGQAYHWFEPEPAHREIARVLAPGGVFAPIWNIRDESVPWVARLSDIVDGPTHDGHAGLADLDFGPRFGPTERATFRHELPMTAEGLVRLIATRSYYLVAPPEKQAALEAAIRALAAELPEPFPLPYRTVVHRARRR
jgi:SAM-dependent methyltransferase